jgi:peptidoglycan hydrolase-like protein with peptidoglycan-binding domain
MPTTVQLGSTGDDVKRVQRVLRRSTLIAPYGPITGVFDAELDAGVRAFQESSGLVVDGIVGPVTWSHLPAYREASPTLRTGSTGPTVGFLQLTLAGDNLGAPDWATYTGAIDGIFGPQTEASVRSLQSVKGVAVDGIVGDQTWFAWLTPGTAQKLTLEGATIDFGHLPATV